MQAQFGGHLTLVELSLGVSHRWRFMLKEDAGTVLFAEELPVGFEKFTDEGLACSIWIALKRPEWGNLDSNDNG